MMNHQFQIQLQSFLCSNHLEHASEEQLLDFFSSIERHEIPFANPFVPFDYLGNFQSGENPNTIIYYGRSHFRNLFALIKKIHLNEFQDVRVIGTMGCGKSHLLAALAVYLHSLLLSNARMDEN